MANENRPFITLLIDTEIMIVTFGSSGCSVSIEEKGKISFNDRSPYTLSLALNELKEPVSLNVRNHVIRFTSIKGFIDISFIEVHLGFVGLTNTEVSKLSLDVVDFIDTFSNVNILTITVLKLKNVMESCDAFSRVSEYILFSEIQAIKIRNHLPGLLPKLINRIESANLGFAG